MRLKKPNQNRIITESDFHSRTSGDKFQCSHYSWITEMKLIPDNTVPKFGL